MKRIWLALLYSLSGLRLAFADEAAFRQEILLSILLLPLAFFLADSGVELALMWFSVLLVVMLELVNSAVEAAIDRGGDEVHPLAKKAKDTASAAVFIALVNVAMVWGVLLWM